MEIQTPPYPKQKKSTNRVQDQRRVCWKGKKKKKSYKTPYLNRSTQIKL